jgi:hypothetical protein
VIAAISLAYSSTKARCHIQRRSSRNDRRTIRNPDSKPRSYRDIKAVAIASAEFLKTRNPNSNIAVKDLRTGEVTPVAFRPQRA